MLYEIMNGFAVVFSFLGIFFILYGAVLLLLRPCKDEKYTVVVCIDSFTPEVCERLYAHLMRIDLRGETHNAYVLLVDTGMSDESRSQCKRFCTESKNIELCSPDELLSAIGRLQKDSKDGLSANGRKYRASGKRRGNRFPE